MSQHRVFTTASCRGRIPWNFLLAAGGILLAMVAAVPVRIFAQQLAPVWGVSTVAGTGTLGDSGDSGQATKATLNKPVGVAVDRAGNLYISEANTTAGSITSVIRKVTPEGIISTIAGKPGSVGYAGDGGAASAALLNNPYGIEIDRDGNLLIGDISNYEIRKIDMTSGIITTVAGIRGSAGYTGDGGPATSAKLYTAYTAASDAAGNIYIADNHNNVIRKVDTAGNISTFAGTGIAGHSGDGGPAKSAQISGPYSVWVDPAGNLYINELGAGASYIRMIDTAGIIHTIAGSGTAGYSGDEGSATAARLNTPHGTVIDGRGNFYIADETNQIIRGVDSAGVIHTIAGIYNGKSFSGDGVPALAAKFNYPYGIAIDSNNNLYVPDTLNNRVRQLSLNTVAPPVAIGGSSTQNLFVASTTAVTLTSATISPLGDFSVGALSGCSFGTQLAANTPCTIPYTFTPTAAGLRTAQLTLTDSAGIVSRIGITGMGIAPQVAFGLSSISTIAGTGTAGFNAASGSASGALLNMPRGGVADSAGNLFFADSGNNAIRRIDAVSGAITTVAGTGQPGYSGDGSAATAAQLNVPAKVVVDATGNLYIADTGNNVIRFVDASTGFISTIAGNGIATYSGDGGLATSASLNAPQGLAVDLGGHVYVADTGNNAIRYFGKGGDISTFAGNGASGYAGDGGNVHDAQLAAPQAVALDGKGSVYIADTGNSVLRMVSATNRITTIAGQQGINVNGGDGSVARSASLANPSDVAIDAAGDLYLAANGLVRMIDGNGNISTIAGTGDNGAFSGEGGPAVDALLPSPASNIFLDSSANVYVADTADNRLLKIASATAPTIVFATQSPNATGSPQRVLVQNVGNKTLQLGTITVSGPFALQSADSTACTATTALAPGMNCSLSIAFMPTDRGQFTGAVVIRDNALNNNASTQTIQLAGVGSTLSATKTQVTLIPSSAVYGQTAQSLVTATVSSDAATTGSVTFTLNGAQLAKISLSNGSASINLPSLQAGTYNLEASYSGDSNNSSSSGSVQVVVQPAVLTVTVADASRHYLYDANPVFTYTITGFVNGDTSSVVSGTPSITTTATQDSPAGTYAITATAGTLSAANYIFTFVPAKLTVTAAPPADFTLSVSPRSVAMENGGSATFSFSLTSMYGYDGTVQFACSAPANMICKFNPATLKGNPSGAVSSQLTILLGSAYARSSAKRVGGIMVAMLLGLGCVFRRRRSISVLLMLVILAGTWSLSGCGNFSNTLPAAGTSQVTITATDSASKQTHSATVTVTIQ